MYSLLKLILKYSQPGVIWRVVVTHIFKASFSTLYGHPLLSGPPTSNDSTRYSLLALLRSIPRAPRSLLHALSPRIPPRI